MKEIEKIDITSCTVEDRRQVLHAFETKLTEAKAARDRILIAIRKTSAEIDKGDRRASFAGVVLAKEDAAAARLILELEAQVADARKRVAMAVNQAAVIAAKRAAADAGAGEHNRLFEVATPDGRIVRHWHESAGSLSAALMPGYRVLGEVYGAHGDELVAFLARRGIGAHKEL